MKQPKLSKSEIKVIIGYLENERKRIWEDIPPWEESSDELEELLAIIAKLRAMVD